MDLKCIVMSWLATTGNMVRGFTQRGEKWRVRAKKRGTNSEWWSEQWRLNSNAVDGSQVNENDRLSWMKLE